MFYMYDPEVKLFSVSFFLETVYVIMFGLIIGGIAFFILIDILFVQRRNLDTIIGGICVYFLIGFLWVWLYNIIYSWDNHAFSQAILTEEDYSRCLYFSFTTLTSLGYGDILPVSPLAKMLTNLEAVVGQMYPASLIAILVSGYVSSKPK